MEGIHTISVTIKGLHVQGGPFSVRARAGRNYATIGVPKFEFGTEGENDGQVWSLIIYLFLLFPV